MIDHGQINYGWNSIDPPHYYIFPAIEKLLPEKNMKILDAGCGNGYVAGRLASLGYQIIGVDISKDGIDLARRAYPAVKFEIGSVYEDFSKITGPVDLCVSSEVIEHLYYPKIFLKNAYSIIRPGGWIIITTPYHGYLKNLTLSLFNKWDQHFTVDREGGHIKFFSEKTLVQMLKTSGFDNIVFNNAGRIKGLWKSMVCRAQKPR